MSRGGRGESRGKRKGEKEGSSCGCQGVRMEEMEKQRITSRYKIEGGLEKRRCK